MGKALSNSKHAKDLRRHNVRHGGKESVTGEPPLITIPYLFSPKDYQREHVFRPFDEGFKRIVHVWNRRAGKDKTDWNLMIREALTVSGNYYYIFPTYNQGKKAIWDAIDGDGVKFLDHIPPKLILKKNESDMKFELRTTTERMSTIQIVGAKEVDRLVGTNPRGLVFSDYSVSNPKAWDLLRPIVAQNGGWAIFNGTPRGMNHLWELLQTAKQYPNVWYSSVLSVDDTKSLSPEALEAEKREMPQDLFEQEYYSKFIEGASSVFKNIDACVYDGNIKLSEYHRYHMGVDLAKVSDYTVVTPIDLMEMKVGMPERFNTIDYNVQKSRIEALYYKYKEPLTRVDSTGVGEPIFDDLVYRGIKNLEAFHFTEVSRRDLLTNLQILLEQGKIKIPNYEILLDELRSFQYTLSDTGKVKMEVPEGKHDDCVMSLALAVWNLPQNPLKSTDKVRADREILQNYDSYRAKKLSPTFTRRWRYW